jgi:hypothetical protein
MSKKYNENKAQAAMDAEQLLQYFVQRDVMNSWVHLDNHAKGLNTRFSPITLAAERVMAAAWDYAFGDDGVTPPTIKSITGA